MMATPVLLAMLPSASSFHFRIRLPGRHAEDNGGQADKQIKKRKNGNSPP
jgi:hypothetical protein